MTLLKDKLLLSKSDLTSYREISQNITDEKLNIFIREAQVINVRTFLGVQLYLRMLNDYDTATKTFTTQRYTDLWYGIDYTNTASVEVRFNGLMSAAIYFAYSRFLQQQNTNVGRFGVGSLSQDDTESSTVASVNTNSRQAANMALAYQQDCEIFLKDQVAIYPEFGTKTTTGQKLAFNFFKI